jgi:hypothetical protein
MIIFEWLNGLTLGIEHMSGDEDDFFEWAIVVHVAVFRITYAKLIEE